MPKINNAENADDRRNAVKVMVDGEWVGLYKDKLSRFNNLSDLTDVEAAVRNLRLDDKYINRDVAMYGKEPGIIHHALIKQTPAARFVSDAQIRFWNSKTTPVTGTANFPGLSREITIEHGIKDTQGVSVTPIFCSYCVHQDTGGRIGEVWMRWDDTHIYVGNTGSYTGAFTWIALW
jgi:hypothetical protein